ncbi:riboflavin synthase [Nadsonia fulvescens var. elongata DSM 6958]|uniref:Riboflavin synthase n=1 Tax=Nadsonia fulvescens var. elongata DSM 6958 TaxID=857566 RepID=A0A1E3PNU3_9ASCO|nr:riboflavin synthase [Nadsonia fulvescens var. elongata DSM 6958]
MFTGLVETMGKVAALEKNAITQHTTLTVSDAAIVLVDCHLGDSIAVNGTCLTVIEFDTNSCKFGIAPETISRTNLGILNTGDSVNLERAVAEGVRFGGHFVQGHVDTVAYIRSASPDGDSIRYGFELRDKEYIKYIVEKGYVCLDGTSLTVTAVDDVEGTFGIMLVDYSQQKVIMPSKSLGAQVNVEVDFTGKLIEKQVEKSVETKLKAILDDLIAEKVKVEVDRVLKSQA